MSDPISLSTFFPRTSRLIGVAQSEYGESALFLADCEVVVSSVYALSSLMSDAEEDNSPGIIVDLRNWSLSVVDLLNACHAILREDGTLIVLFERGKGDGPGGEAGERGVYLAAVAGHYGFGLSGDLISDAPSARILVLTKRTTPRWRLSDTEPMAISSWTGLFQRSFGTAISPELWRWKYDKGLGRAIAAYRGEDIVGYYGAVQRRISFRGQPALALQICDVMVDPTERAAMTKQGVFFQITSTFLETYFGYLDTHFLAYGFPNLRHMRLGERIGFYGEVERLVELKWPARSAGRWGSTVSHVWDGHDDGLLSSLWLRMSRDLSEAIVVIRDPAYLHYRYRKHPERRYEFLLVTRRFTARPLGIAVLRRDPDACCLVDVVAPLSEIPHLVEHARDWAARWGVPWLSTWITTHFADFFAVRNGDAEINAMDVCVPTNVWSRGPSIEEVRNRWWLMMGDTDFS